VFSVGWEWLALGGLMSGNAPKNSIDSIFGIVFPVFGIPFVIVGIGMMLTPVIAWRRALRTVYVVGDKRFSTVTIGRTLKVTTYPRDRITSVQKSEKSNGSGTLTLSLGSRYDSDGDKVTTTETLYGIPEVRKVERLIWDRGASEKLL